MEIIAGVNIGGRVEKIWWYLVDFISDAVIDLDISSSISQSVSLEGVHASEASEIVSVWVAPYVNNFTIIKGRKL